MPPGQKEYVREFFKSFLVCTYQHNDHQPAPTASIVTASTMQSTINLCGGAQMEEGEVRVRTGKNK